MKSKIKRIKTALIIFIVVISLVLSGGMFVISSSLFEYLSKVDNVEADEFTFDHFELRDYEYGVLYEIFFDELDDSLWLEDRFINDAEKTLIPQLKKGETVVVYYGTYRGQFAIFEMSTDSFTFYDYYGYLQARKEKALINIVALSICSVIIIVSIVFSAWVLSYKNPETNLGKIKLEYKMGDNFIRVYNSPYVCSLAVNDKILDQHWGLVGTITHLKGEVTLDSETILVEAKHNAFTTSVLKLFIDGKQVSKKLMILP